MTPQEPPHHPPPRLIKIILEHLPPEIWEDSPLYDNNEKHLF